MPQDGALLIGLSVESSVQSSSKAVFASRRSR